MIKRRRFENAKHQQVYDALRERGTAAGRDVAAEATWLNAYVRGLTAWDATSVPEREGTIEYACWAAGVDQTEAKRNLNWHDAVVFVLEQADPERDFEALCSFGAAVYANVDSYYERMEGELASGSINKHNLAIVLSLEKPEFMDSALRQRHWRLVERCR